jgi:hypothetical protein
MFFGSSSAGLDLEREPIGKVLRQDVMTFVAQPATIR